MENKTQTNQQALNEMINGIGSLITQAGKTLKELRFLLEAQPELKTTEVLETIDSLHWHAYGLSRNIVQANES